MSQVTTSKLSSAYTSASTSKSALKPAPLTFADLVHLSPSRLDSLRLPDHAQSTTEKGQADHRHAELFLAYLQEQEKSTADLSISNDVDTQPCPEWNFAYTDGYVLVPPVEPTEKSQLTGCSCEDDECDPATCECFSMHQALDPETWSEQKEFAYDEEGRMRPGTQLGFGAPIWECNSSCGCSSSCTNRVVQKGRTVDVDLYKTKERGWGLRARSFIPEGTYLSVYAGELVDADSAEDRGREYDRVGSTYMLDIDCHHIIRAWLRDGGEADREPILTIDATLWGNLTRFLNHSCDPNLWLYPVYTHERDIFRPYFAFFTIRDVDEGEELTFSYKGDPDPDPGSANEKAEGDPLGMDVDEIGLPPSQRTDDDSIFSVTGSPPKSGGVGPAAERRDAKQQERRRTTAAASAALNRADAKPGEEVRVKTQDEGRKDVRAMRCLCGARNCNGVLFR